MYDQVVFALSKLIKEMTELTKNTRKINNNLEKLLWEIKSNGKREDC